ncbi:MAG: hypothetical protein ACRD15_03860 [Vicinamibacterales bacterium]
MSRSGLAALAIAVSMAASGAASKTGSRAPDGEPTPLVSQTPAAGTPIETLTPELRARILEAMRLNRRTFHEASVLKRYGETRPPQDHPAFAKCDLPRTSSGDPAAQYPAAKARAAERSYRESAFIDCIGTTGGLSGTRAKPLAQHYYCGLPGFSPDIRGCFTFQLRLDSVSAKRSAVDTEAYLPGGSKRALEKRWNFLGPDPRKVPDVAKAFEYCATDGRPHEIRNTSGARLKVSTIHPTPTRPMCWIVETQVDLFQGIMSGLIDPPVADQIALLREYYDCDRIKGKVSAARFKAMCQFDAGE